MEDEQKYLSYVLEKLKRRVEEVEHSLKEGEKEVEGMHEYYWENYMEMDEYGYENFDNQQALLQQMNVNEERKRLAGRLKKMLSSPYFGRVDFVYQEEDSKQEDEAETFYIGIGNFAERAGALPLIYDWRAPVAGLFYDYDKGPAMYMAPSGKMEGEIVSKHQYKIRDGKMIYQFESDVKIDDEILKEELGAGGDVKLKNIIRTIQKEQNRIIRDTSHRILVIQGAAGSGKTSVALHRIAYLLYHDRKNLKSSDVLILSPNSIFADYISRILPELGEENIKEMSFDLFAYRQLKDIAEDCEDRYDYLERLLKDPLRKEKDSEKLLPSLLAKLDGYILSLEDSLMDIRRVEYQGVVMKESRIFQLFYEKFGDIPLLSRMDAVAEVYVDEYETLKNKDLEEEEKELIRGFFLSMYTTRDLFLLYNDFLKEAGFSPLKEVAREERVLPYEDVYPALYLKYSLYAPKRQSRIKHLVIDEMQDYSELQYRILEKMFDCDMTILGDRAQTMDSKIQDVTAFLPKIFGRKVCVLSMDTSYRNTVEIASYANQITNVTGIRLFERHGKAVDERRADTLRQAAFWVMEEIKNSGKTYETIALITLTQREADEAAGYLKEAAGEQNETEAREIFLVDRDTQSFSKGISVAPFYLAKGLEFDQVFVLFPRTEDIPLYRQAKYIAATRALHELSVYEVG